MPEGSRRSIALTVVTWGALIVFVVGALLAACGYIVTDPFEISIAGTTVKGGNVGLALCALGALVLCRIIGKTASVELFSSSGRSPIGWLAGRGPGPWLVIALVCAALLFVGLII